MKKVVRQGSRLNKHKPNNIVNESYEANHFRSAEAADALRVGEPQQSGDALNPGGLANPAGEAKIGFARPCVPRGVVVLCAVRIYVRYAGEVLVCEHFIKRV